MRTIEDVKEAINELGKTTFRATDLYSCFGADTRPERLQITRNLAALVREGELTAEGNTRGRVYTRKEPGAQ
jgi:hypothetical protein